VLFVAVRDMGVSIHHRGWTLQWEGDCRLVWPVYPYNPYADGPEKSLEYAVGALSFPLDFTSASSSERAIRVTLDAR